MPNPCYFLVSVSNRENLELCMQYGLAGFPSGASGVWTFCEIQDGDFISFLYGARAHNLYRVVERKAYKDALNLPPWKPLTFKESKKTYSFPFRLELKLIRVFEEPLVRAEFSYVAENLLLRGGYRKTHFQADQTTLQSVSQMGSPFSDSIASLALPPHEIFIPAFARDSKLLRVPEVCRFQETILQTAIRRYLQQEEKLASFLGGLKLLTHPTEALEVLGEKALPQGHIDLLIKLRTPLGSALKIPIEVKLNAAQAKDVLQLRDYEQELGGDCPGTILIAAEFNKRTIAKARSFGMRLVRYSLNVDFSDLPNFDQICQALNLEVLP